MKNDMFNSKHLLSAVAASTLLLTAVSLPNEAVYADTSSLTSTVLTPKETSFSFVATILNANGNTLSGKVVEVRDTVDPNNTVIASSLSDSSGQAVFSNLPINRNLSVSVDGLTQQYNLRTNEAGSKIGASFTAKASSQETTVGETIPGKSVAVTLPETSLKSKTGESFNFTAVILGKNGHVIEGKTVELFDITDGKAEKLGTQVSDKDGKARFEGLPLSRNISVRVLGDDKAYTVRTDQAGAERATAFYLNEIGKKAPQYTKNPLTITVRDEEGQAIPNQLVSVKNVLGQKVAELLTDANGQAIFTDKLMEGAFYQFAVNGIVMHDVTPGNTISAYLRSDQQRKQTPTRINPVDEGDYPKKEESKDKGLGLADKQKQVVEKQEMVKPTKTRHQDEKSPNKKNQDRKTKGSLPQTGEKAVSLLSLVGLISVGLAAILLLAKKYQKRLK
ncbi:LPXTG cell wall anchor domain-containing protein [Streptococcus pseudoporcinus]|uniref:Gram positive anchor n=1 Tax=Streptococcus pseudoporcinus LQ 940-04 TaxID=875093 RepID=G5K6X0_9STRE|nr:LPXTG cell wall anchor domain-containing protein [Streptococcus pseudoporcinus]EFR44159.1 LPXTG-motif cell wall anchor domain protein [Streptococcus pseudoporcinus SPIN 20026]EHI65865.1 gram positive anchor [Streptococcus pseudoporcinus LQ 940-04]VEF94666.1 cell wall surface anchor family protein [Streptococcus pseudoporcinus]